MPEFFPWDEIYRHTLPLHGISVGEKALRPLIVYIALAAGLRIAGKRELAQINPLDLIVLLTLSNTVQNAIIGNDNTVSGGLIGAVTLLTVNYLLARTVYRHPRANWVLNGNPVTLVDDGKLQTDTLRHELITEQEVHFAIRRQGIKKFEDVETAVLEPSGAITVLPRHPTTEEAFFYRIEARLERIETALQTRPAD